MTSLTRRRRTPASQHAYLTGYHEDFTRCQRRHFESYATRPECADVWVRGSGPGSSGCVMVPELVSKGARWGHSPPECKLGASIAIRGVPMRSFAFASRNPAAAPSIVRGACPANMNASGTGIDICPGALASMIPGPWSPKSHALACLPQGQRPEGWEGVCADHGCRDAAA